LRRPETVALPHDNLLHFGYKPHVETFDVLIIGGGISGLGVAREVASAGCSSLVLEAGTCGNATSNNTLRIIHGGFRYLQNFDLPRVIKSLNDQSALLNEVPGAVSPLPCLMPLTRFGVKSRLPVTCATLLYGAIMRANSSPLPAPHIVSPEKLHSTVKTLRSKAPHGALCWYDAVMTDPAAVTRHLMTQVTTAGGAIHEGTPVERVEGRNQNFTVHTTSGETFAARCVINTLGPWLGAVQAPKELIGPRPRWCKGFNLVIKQQLDPTYGIGVQSSDGRLFFYVPRGTGTAIGTWYLPHPDISVAPSVSEHEVAQFLHAFNASLPEAGITKHDIVHIDVGVLPMERTSPSGPQLIAHERIHEREGYIEVLSTKYTTFRSQGRRVAGVVKQIL
jgi:glycerol-3-phosphate dehydrogenase